MVEYLSDKEEESMGKYTEDAKELLQYVGGSRGGAGH